VAIIPVDADHIRAKCVEGNLQIDWYADPQDSPEWWNKDLGFSTTVDQEYGTRVAMVINELVERLVESERLRAAENRQTAEQVTRARKAEKVQEAAEARAVELKKEVKKLTKE